MYLDSQLLILNYQISIYCVNFVPNFVVLVIHSKDSDKRAKYKAFLQRVTAIFAIYCKGNIFFAFYDETECKYK